MKKFSLLIQIITALLIFTKFNCKNPTAPNSGLTLSVADVSCTEAWLGLNAGSLPLPANIVVNKNRNKFLSFTLTSRDTTLYDSSLAPNQAYTYRAIYGNNTVNGRYAKSETVTAKTMDTTSSNYTCRKFTFGVGGDNNLKDVAIINDTSIWAVGKFAIQDSGWYNAAHWDGREWNYLLLKAIASNGNITTPEFSGLFLFSNDNIWFA